MQPEIKCDILQDGIGISSKPDAVGELIVTFTIKTRMDPGSIARVFNLQKQKCPQYFKLGTDQATMDIFAVGVKTEEAWDELNKLASTGLLDEEEQPGPGELQDSVEHRSTDSGDDVEIHRNGEKVKA